MINKIMKMDLAKSAKNVSVTAQKLNDKAIDTTETLIDETLAVGEQWQAVMEKALHVGVDIFGKQQDLTLTALEAVKEQYLSGNDRMVKLLGLEGFKFNEWTNTFFNKAKKASATAANKVSTTILKAEEEKVKSEAIKDIVEKNKIEAVPTVIEVAEKAAKTVKVAAKETTKAVKKTVKATTATAKKGAKATTATAKKGAKATAATAKASTAKVVKKTTKAATATTTAAKKAATKTVATAAKTVKASTPKVAKDKLTLIEGIGPKIEEVLNNTGIMTFQHLSTYTAEALENILITANPRYKRFQPTTWAAQAKFAAEGKMEELKAWQDELNGGKVVK